ncbi:MAG TPA: hypothetical protein VMU17_06445 [Elusimicrobiota bacterium]|nr:hypothetical protein [Elusimicrobiota bacterium]
MASKVKPARKIETIADSSWLIPPAIAGAFLAAWSIVILALYFRAVPLRWDYLSAIIDQWSQLKLWHPYLLRGLLGAVTATWLLWAAYECGAYVIGRFINADAPRGTERTVLATGLGVAIISNGVLILGAAHAWYAGVFYGCLGAITITAFMVPRGRDRWTGSTAFLKNVPWSPVWIFLATITLGLWLLGSLSPEVFFDSLHYHLAIPNQYALAHRVYSFPSTIYSNFVMALHLFYGLAITIGNTFTAKFVHYGLAIVLAAAFIAFGQRYLSPGAGLLSAVIFLSLPMVGINVVTAGIDVAWSALQFLAAYALIRALDIQSASGPGARDTAAPARRRWYWLAGALAGYAASCKYLGFPYLPLAFAILIWRRRFDDHASWTTVAREAGHFTAAATLLVLPQLLKNVAFNHNPIYPFLGTHWGAPRLDPADWRRFFADQNARDLRAEFSSWPSALAFIFHPWTLTLRDAGGMSSFGPLGLMLLPAVFLLRAPSPAYRTLRRFAGGAWLLWLLTTTVTRYGMPALALASPLLAEGILRAGRSKTVRVALLAAVAAGAFSNWALTAGIAYQIGGWQVVGGWMSEADYLGDMHASYPTPPYDGIAWMNQHLPAEAKVCVMGDSRSYYLQRRAIPSSTPGEQAIVQIVRASRDGDDVAGRLRAEGITHLYLNMAEAVRTEQYQLFPWDERTWPVFSEFWERYVRLVWKEENFTREHFKAQYVYDILTDAGSRRPHDIPPCPLARWAPKNWPNRRANP